MPDTCTIVGNTITCSTGVDWITVAIAVFTAIVPAAIGVLAAVGATRLASKHQREEASKQRKIVATAAIMRAAFNMVRSSHRDKHEMRDHASEFEISVRMLSVELQSEAGDAFIAELTYWRRSIAADCRDLMAVPPEGNHDTPEINTVRTRANEFAAYLEEWLHLSDRELGVLVAKMHEDWKRLWPEVEPDRRFQSRLGADGESA